MVGKLLRPFLFLIAVPLVSFGKIGLTRLGRGEVTQVLRFWLFGKKSKIGGNVERPISLEGD